MDFIYSWCLNVIGSSSEKKKKINKKINKKTPHTNTKQKSSTILVIIHNGAIINGEMYAFMGTGI